MRFRALITAATVVALLAAPSGLAAASPDPEIAGLQVALRSKGLYFGKIDGLPGPMTAKGLRSFQRLTGLPVTGELGRAHPRPARRARAAARRAPSPRPGRLRLGRERAPVPARARRPSAAARRRRPLRRVHEGGGRSASSARAALRRTGSPAPPPAPRSARAAGRRVVTRSAVRRRPLGLVSRAARRHADRDRDEAQDDRARAGEGEQPQVRSDLLVEGAKLRLPAAAGTGQAEELSRSTVRAHLDTLGGAATSVPANLARALAWQESGFQTNITSSVGAWGPMQVMPETWAFVETVLLGHKVPRTGRGRRPGGHGAAGAPAEALRRRPAACDRRLVPGREGRARATGSIPRRRRSSRTCSRSAAGDSSARAAASAA